MNSAMAHAVPGSLSRVQELLKTLPRTSHGGGGSCQPPLSNRSLLSDAAAAGASWHPERSTQMHGAATNTVAAAQSNSGDFKVTQLAERMSVLLASMQRQSDIERQTFERQLEDVDARVRSVCSQVASLDNLLDASSLVRQTKSCVSEAIGELRAEWMTFRSEHKCDHQELVRRVGDLGDRAERDGCRLQEAEDKLQKILCREPPQWFWQLEEAVASMEKRLQADLGKLNVAMEQRRVECEGLRLRNDTLQALQNSVVATVDERLEQEFERLARVGHAGLEPSTSAAVHIRAAIDAGKRLDEVEARVSALRLRIDSSESRFRAIADRSDAACTQSIEAATTTVVTLKEELLRDVDCQLGLFRQRFESLSDRLDELAFTSMTQRSRPILQRQRAADEAGL
eukprot:TRINITY_DN56423_c0_g1_i1.p1 TRINITY_DN56423_c0_g1~~TRINITY_DN56423_c0_g1_i1.p1  ORF type:complete len:399 (+),score=101.58 TRINITY_DN56423_c0_g1_i1:34-1230(+)